MGSELPNIYPRDVQVEITVNTPPDTGLDLPSYQIALSLESNRHGLKRIASMYVSIGDRTAPNGIMTKLLDGAQVSIDYCKTTGLPIGIEFHNSTVNLPETMDYLDKKDDLILIEAFNLGVVSWNLLVISTDLYNDRLNGEDEESGAGDDYYSE